MHTWNWCTWNGLPYLTCSLLEGWIHGFFTREFSPRSPDELVEALWIQADHQQLPPQVYRVKQVHGNTVLTTSELTSVSSPQGSDEAQDFSVASEISVPSTSQYLEADGLLTQQSGQAVWVCSADCAPVLIADPSTGQVAAVHAGWRGTAAEIVPVAIARFVEQFSGVSVEQLRIAIGPAIAGEVYQVSEKVAVQVGATVCPDQNHPNHNTASILEFLQNLTHPPVFPDPQPGRLRLDVRLVIALQLERLGIAPEQVAIAPYCTYQTPEHFFSYRRDQLKLVQWSGIVSH